MAKKTIKMGDYVRHTKTGNIGKVLAKYKKTLSHLGGKKPVDVIDVTKPDDKGFWEGSPASSWETTSNEEG